MWSGCTLGHCDRPPNSSQRIRPTTPPSSKKMKASVELWTCTLRYFLSPRRRARLCLKKRSSRRPSPEGTAESIHSFASEEPTLVESSIASFRTFQRQESRASFEYLLGATPRVLAAPGGATPGFKPAKMLESTTRSRPDPSETSITSFLFGYSTTLATPLPAGALNRNSRHPPAPIAKRAIAQMTATCRMSFDLARAGLWLETVCVIPKNRGLPRRMFDIVAVGASGYGPAKALSRLVGTIRWLRQNMSENLVTGLTANTSANAWLSFGDTKIMNLRTSPRFAPGRFRIRCRGGPL